MEDSNYYLHIVLLDNTWYNRCKNVVKGLYGDGFAYVKWDGENQLDMSVNLYDVIVLKEV